MGTAKRRNRRRSSVNSGESCAWRYSSGVSSLRSGGTVIGRLTVCGLRVIAVTIGCRRAQRGDRVRMVTAGPARGPPTAGQEDDRVVTGPGSFERGTGGPRVILVGVDGSPTSLRAAAYAAGLARRQRSRLVAVYVAEPAPPMAGWVPAAEVAARGAAEQVDAELRQELGPASERLGIAVEYRTAHGDPVTALSRIADELPADAVLVG